MKNEIPVPRCARQAGTWQSGTDLVTAALNPDSRVQIDNLCVVDTSVFPIGAVNPALTAMPTAHRVGDHLLTRLA